MSKKNEKGIATAADLLALSEGTKTVTLKTCGWKVEIKKATFGELSNIVNAVGPDNTMEQIVFLTFRCMVKPKMELNALKNLPHGVLIEISSEISKFSGLDKKSVEKMRNLLGIESVGQSSL